MKKIILSGYILFTYSFAFSIDLNDSNFYRSLEKSELIFFINLLEKEQEFSNDGCILQYIALAHEVLKEKNVNSLKDNSEFKTDKEFKHLIESRNYNNARLVSEVSKDLNILVFIDNKDGFLKTLDGRNVSIRNGKFIIIDPFLNSNFYYDVSNEYTTLEIYNKSILKPNLNRFLLDDRSRLFVYLSEFNRQVYLDDIVKLGKDELVFLFYELFPISKLKGLKDWYDFGFVSISKALHKVYLQKMNLRKKL